MKRFPKTVTTYSRWLLSQKTPLYISDRILNEHLLEGFTEAIGVRYCCDTQAFPRKKRA